MTIALAVLSVVGCGEVLVPSMDDPPVRTLQILLIGAARGVVRSETAGLRCDDACAADYPVGTQVSLVAEAGPEARFAGWRGGGCGYDANCTAFMWDNLKIEARFEPETRAAQVSLTVATVGPGRVTVAGTSLACPGQCTAEFEKGGTVVLVATATASAGFAGWSGGGCEGLDPTCALRLDDDTQVVATFTAQPERVGINIILQGAGGGTVRDEAGLLDCPDVSCAAEQNVGDVVHLTAASAPGASFRGWTGVPGCSQAPSCSFAVVDRTVVGARFEPDMTRVMVTKSGPGDGNVSSSIGGLDCGAVCSTVVPIGTQLILTATPGARYWFAGWSGACSGRETTCRLSAGSTDVLAQAEFVIRPSLSAGGGRTCLVTEDGVIRCWGLGSFGALGRGDTATIGDDPQEVVRGDVDLGGALVVEASSGYLSTCARTTTDEVHCWGWQGGYGYGSPEHLGDDPLDRLDRPVTVAPGPWIGVSAGGHLSRWSSPALQIHSCALDPMGQVYCWGMAGFGQLGRGSIQTIGAAPQDLAAPVPGLPPADAIFSGGAHSCALTGGRVFCWGAGGVGQLGSEGVQSIGDDPGEAAHEVVFGEPIAQLALGGGHSCALSSVGAIYCWGLGESGQLGYGDTRTRGDGIGPSPSSMAVPLPRAATQVVAGTAHSCAVLAGGGVTCWGANEAGQLGVGHTQAVGDDPSEVGGLVDLGQGTVIDVAAGDAHSCALVEQRGQFAVRCWGSGPYLGYGSLANVGDRPGSSPRVAGDVPVF